MVGMGDNFGQPSPSLGDENAQLQQSKEAYFLDAETVAEIQANIV